MIRSDTRKTLIQLDSKVGLIVLTNTGDSNLGQIAQRSLFCVCHEA